MQNFAYLITSSTAWFLTVTVVSSTVQLSILPEIDHIYEEFIAGTTDKTSRVPKFVISSTLSIDSWVSLFHVQFAPETELQGKLQSYWIFWKKPSLVNTVCDLVGIQIDCADV